MLDPRLINGFINRSGKPGMATKHVPMHWIIGYGVDAVLVTAA